MKTIFITGANRGLGLGFCKYYLRQDVQVIATCRQPAVAAELQQLKQDYNNIIIEELDVCNTKQLFELAAKYSHQAIDILINNAGVYSLKKINYQHSEQGWVDIFKTNTIAPYLVSHTLVPNFILGAEKKIINISSYMASMTLNDNALEPPYRVSKAALNAVTKSLAIEFMGQNISVFAIDPGWVRTDMGGENALLSVAQSVSYITQLISSLTLSSSGKFMQYDGKELPW